MMLVHLCHRTVMEVSVAKHSQQNLKSQNKII